MANKFSISTVIVEYLTIVGITSKSAQIHRSIPIPGVNDCKIFFQKVFLGMLEAFKTRYYIC